MRYLVLVFGLAIAGAASAQDVKNHKKPPAPAAQSPAPGPLPVDGAKPPPVPDGRSAAPTPPKNRDAGLLEKELNEKLPMVDTCYNEFLKVHPKQGGAFNISFTIQPDGSVTNSKVISGPFQDKTFFDCLSKTIEGWKLTPSTGEPETLTLPFSFTPD